ncbi:MAG: hypothetical protein ABSH33_07045 [Steroidobacteraceae bacterium]|jgi:uncharacterized membrane protein
MQRLQWGALALLVVGYAGLSHYSAEAPNARGLGAALSIGPVLLIAILVAWRWTRPFTAVLIAAALCAAVYRYWAIFEKHFEWADLVQQCGAYALVAGSFARSLIGGRVPLCTQLAQKIHGELTPAETAYTHRATLAWAIFYGLLTIAILVLFILAPLRVWSMFVNFGTFGLMILLGIADHAIRRRVLPRHPAGGLLTVIRRALIG